MVAGVDPGRQGAADGNDAGEDDSAQTETDAGEIDIETLDPVDVRALTGGLSVHEDDEPVRGADDLYLVKSKSGNEYVVDARDQSWACECDDQFWRDRICKHARRVQFELGVRSIPDWANEEEIDWQFRRHLSDADRGVI